MFDYAERRLEIEQLIGVQGESLGAVRVGIDAVHMGTWERHVRIGGQALLARTYWPAEISYSDGRIDRLSTRLAAKEAVLKVLGTGIRGVSLREVEIVSSVYGRPTVNLHDRAHAFAAEIGLDRVEVSLCHEHHYAMAFAIGVGQTSG